MSHWLTSSHWWRVNPKISNDDSFAHVQVLVLRRVSENSLQKTKMHEEEADKIFLVNAQPLASNIYSASELQLLSWLNMHYQSMREAIWAPGRSQYVHT